VSLSEKYASVSSVVMYVWIWQRIMTVTTSIRTKNKHQRCEITPKCT